MNFPQNFDPKWDSLKKNLSPAIKISNGTEDVDETMFPTSIKLTEFSGELLNKIFINILGDHVDIIHPDSMLSDSIFDKDQTRMEKGIKNFLSLLLDKKYPDFCNKSQNQALNPSFVKPVVAILKTPSKESPVTSVDALGSIDSHWVALVILPKGFTKLGEIQLLQNGKSLDTLENSARNDRVYLFDPLPSSPPLDIPLSLRQALKLEPFFKVEISPIIHLYNNFYPFSCKKQALSPNTCGDWVLFNSVMLLLDGNTEFWGNSCNEEAFQEEGKFYASFFLRAAFESLVIPESFTNLEYEVQNTLMSDLSTPGLKVNQNISEIKNQGRKQCQTDAYVQELQNVVNQKDEIIKHKDFQIRNLLEERKEPKELSKKILSDNQEPKEILFQKTQFEMEELTHQMLHLSIEMEPTKINQSIESTEQLKNMIKSREEQIQRLTDENSNLKELMSSNKLEFKQILKDLIQTVETPECMPEGLIAFKIKENITFHNSASQEKLIALESLDHLVSLDKEKGSPQQFQPQGKSTSGLFRSVFSENVKF